MSRAQRVVLSLLAATGLLAFLGVLTVWMPTWLLGGLETTDPLDALAARNSLASNLIGGTVVAAAIFTGLVGWRTYQTTREGQWAEQFSVAVKDLDDTSGLLVMSALARLDTLAAQWPAGRMPIAQTLGAHLRQVGTRMPQAGTELAVRSAEQIMPSPATTYAFQSLSRIRGGGLEFVLDLRMANLQGLELRGMEMGWVRLYGANLSSSSLVDVSLSGVSVRLANISAATLRRCNLENATLIGAKFGGAILSGCRLNGAKAQGILADAAALSSIMNNIDARGGSFRGTDFRGSTLTGADLSGADLTAAILDRVDMRTVSLEGANLTAARVSRGLLGSSQLAQVVGADSVRWVETDVPD